MNGKKPSRWKLNEAHKAALHEWIRANPIYTLKEFVGKCKEEFGIKIGQSSVYRSLGYAHITGSNPHDKSSTKEHEEFKKSRGSNQQNWAGSLFF